MRSEIILILVLAAGCVAPAATDLDAQTTTDPVAWNDIGASLFVEHDHTDRAQHEDLAHGLTVAAFSTLSEDNVSLGEYTEADAARGLVAVSVALTDGANIVLLDRAALPEIKVLSVTWESGAYGDVKLDEHAPLLYHAHADGIAFSIWDVSDPTAPRKVGEAQGTGCHMIHPQRIDGATYVWCIQLPETTAYRIETLPAGGIVGVPVGFANPQHDPEVLRYASYYQRLTPLGPALLLATHDLTAQDDPLTGAPVVAVASELNGIRIYDVAVPSAPIEIGWWRGEGLDEELHRVHTVVLHKIGERRIAFAATETFHDAPPHFYFVDFTDYAAPKLLVDWTPPGIEHDDSIRYSAHNLNLAGERAYLANFHGGVWVLDVSDPADPKVIAHRMSARDTGYPEAGKILLDDVTLDENSYWDVNVVDGYAIATDMPAGIEVLAVEGDPHGDPTHASLG